MNRPKAPTAEDLRDLTMEQQIDLLAKYNCKLCAWAASNPDDLEEENMPPRSYPKMSNSEALEIRRMYDEQSYNYGIINSVPGIRINFG